MSWMKRSYTAVLPIVTLKNMFIGTIDSLCLRRDSMNLNSRRGGKYGMIGGKESSGTHYGLLSA